MNLRGIFKHTQANMIAGNATAILGPPGLGKTDLNAALARWWRDYNKGKRVGFSTFFMATQTPIGFTGLPWKGEREYEGRKWTITDPAIPAWFMATDMDTGEVRPAHYFDTVFLSIEEWGQGSPETKRAGAEVLRASGTPPFYLPGNSPVVVNSNVDTRDGITKEFDFIIGRRGQLTVTGDVDVWLEDFADRPYEWKGQEWLVQPTTKAWAKQNPLILFEDKPEKQAPWCNPRSLTLMDRYVQSITKLNNGVVPIKDGDFLQGCAGYIGMGGATSYVSTLKFMIDLPPLEAVVADPLNTPVPNRADLQMLMAYQLAGRVQPDQLPEVVQYMTKAGKPRMPQDLVVTFVSSLIRRDYNAFANHPVIDAWTEKNAYLMSTIAALSNR